MKKILSLLLAAVLCLSCTACGLVAKKPSVAAQTSSSLTDSSWDKVQKAGTLVLGLDNAFPPMGFVDTKTGNLVGFDIDLATEACKRLNIKLKTQPIDWDNLTAEMNNGNIDCVWNGFSKTVERDQTFNLSIPYMKNNQIILVKSDSNYKGLASLSGKTVGVQSKSSAETALNDSSNAKFKSSLKGVVAIGDYGKAVLEIQNGTIDAIAIDEVVARYYSTNPSAYTILQDTNGKDASLAIEDYVVGFRKADNTLKEKINGTLRDMSKDGTMERISKKWFQKDVTTVGK